MGGRPQFQQEAPGLSTSKVFFIRFHGVQSKRGALLTTWEAAEITFTYVPVKDISGNLRTKYKNIKMNRWHPIEKNVGIARKQ